MIVITFFVVVILFSLGLCAWDKLRNYRSKDKSVWIDGDSVHVKKGALDKNIKEDRFMDRIS